MSYVEVLSHKKPRARKQYNCDASEFVKEWVHYGCHLCGNKKVDFSDYRKIITARNEKWKIKKGDIYVYQRNKIEGSIYTFRARQDTFALCVKYDLWGD